MVKIGALWKAKESSKAVLSGKIGDANLLVFKNDYKKKENHPDYIVYVAESRKKSQAQESTDEPYIPDGKTAEPDKDDLPY